ncbi:uncharacterized protein LOC144093057 [Stigmatopora argus]
MKVHLFEFILQAAESYTKVFHLSSPRPLVYFLLEFSFVTQVLLVASSTHVCLSKPCLFISPFRIVCIIRPMSRDSHFSTPSSTVHTLSLIASLRLGPATHSRPSSIGTLLRKLQVNLRLEDLTGFKDQVTKSTPAEHSLTITCQGGNIYSNNYKVTSSVKRHATTARQQR